MKKNNENYTTITILSFMMIVFLIAGAISFSNLNDQIQTLEEENKELLEQIEEQNEFTIIEVTIKEITQDGLLLSIPQGLFESDLIVEVYLEDTSKYAENQKIFIRYYSRNNIELIEERED